MQMPEAYPLPNGAGSITAADLKRSERDTQLDVMSTWFHINYSSDYPLSVRDEEGDYILVREGPYDPHEELYSEFGNFVEEDVIEELSREL